jgi:hypothetical protein
MTIRRTSLRSPSMMLDSVGQFRPISRTGHVLPKDQGQRGADEAVSEGLVWVREPFGLLRRRRRRSIGRTPLL